MRSTILKALATATVLLFVAPPVHAQMFRDWTDRGFAHINLTNQLTSADLNDSWSLTAYDEQGNVETHQRIKGGRGFDVGGGVRVWRHLGVGLGVSRFSDSSSAAIVARIPHPLIFDRPRTATGSADTKHSETGVHLQATWLLPLSKLPFTARTTDRILIGAFVGPSFFKVTQTFVNAIGFSEVGAPFTSANLGGVTTRSQGKWATGVNVGLDISYRVTESVGAGLLLRYAGASADLNAGSGRTQSIDAGGFQIGVGARLRIKNNWRIW